MDDNDIYRVCLSTGVLTVIISQVNKPPRFFNCDAGILFFYFFIFFGFLQFLSYILFPKKVSWSIELNHYT